MPSLAQYAGQAALFAVAAAATGYLSAHPMWSELPPGMAEIKLSLVHGASRVVDCRKLTYEEISKLAPADRRPNTCKRQRIAMRVELRLDGRRIYAEDLEPGGLSHDGPASAYRKFAVMPGAHHIEVLMRDTKRTSGYDYRTVRDVSLAPGQNLAIDFKADAGGFILR